MKKKIFSLLALVMVAMTASATDPVTYSLTKATGAEAQGNITFKVDDTAVTAAAEGATVTMTIEPNDGWVVNTDKVAGEWSAAIAATRGLDMEKDIALTFVSEDATTKARTYTFTMIRANAEISCAYKKLMTNAAITVDDIAEQTYSGQPLEPEVTVKDGTTELTLNTDYTVSYGNSRNAGTGTVTITGAGDNYAGTITKDFVINVAEGSVKFNPWTHGVTIGDEDFIIAPFVVSDGTLSYSSDDEGIATVDSETGLVHIVSAGVVKIFASVSATHNCTAASDYYRLTIHPKVTEEGGVKIVDSGNNVEVTIDDQDSNLDGFTLPEGLTVNKLSYSRQLTEGENVYTVCLPYQPPTSANLTYYTLTGASESTLNFDEISGAPQANTPYLVVVSQTTAIGNDEVTNVTMTKTVASQASAGGYVMKGTFSGIKHDDALGLYILQPENRWGKVGSNTNAYVPPFRAYIEATTANNAPMLSSTFGGETTGIENIRTVDRNGNERWFDLNGRSIEKPATKGVYIQNGRKVILK